MRGILLAIASVTVIWYIQLPQHYGTPLARPDLVFGSGDPEMAVHESDILSVTTLCTGSTYSACGGGNCGAGKRSNLGSIGPSGAGGDVGCTSKVCGGRTVYCGSFKDVKCD